MKKIISMLLVVVMCLGICACASEEEKLYEKYEDIIEALEDEDYEDAVKEIYKLYEKSDAKEEENKEDEKIEEEETEESLDNRYLDDSGNIVLVEFENGKKFILNYNYFDVTVVVDGVKYTVEKCGFDSQNRTYTGYLIINEGGAK